MTEEQSTDSTADAADAVTEASQAEEQASGPVGPGVASTTRNRPGTSEDDVESAKASADAAPNKPAATRVTAESTDDDRDGPTYRVSVPTFEGPLDLLLHLIQKVPPPSSSTNGMTMSNTSFIGPPPARVFDARLAARHRANRLPRQTRSQAVFYPAHS
jgi:hypothetical protein